jgi:hypothetical protein
MFKASRLTLRNIAPPVHLGTQCTSDTWRPSSDEGKNAWSYASMALCSTALVHVLLLS